MNRRRNAPGVPTETKLNMPEIVLIAALAKSNRVIGIGKRLPWHLPEDLKRFKRLTTGYPLLMGRKTFESLLEQFGGPLPNRRHIVLSRRPERISHPVAETFASLDSALEALRGEERVFIGGGEAVYAATIDRAHRLELTIVEGAYEGDAFFPPYDHLIGVRYRLANREIFPGFRFETYLLIDRDASPESDD
jgi:dihydrofolate reductase